MLNELYTIPDRLTICTFRASSFLISLLVTNGLVLIELIQMVQSLYQANQDSPLIYLAPKNDTEIS
ncbi:hypothetical protein HI914_01226 [Erysiphe necator]|nr:hypothetical protein HI914_01226 [Erysiphe necator]